MAKQVTDVKVELFPVRLEHQALVNGATQACRHIAARLNDGEPMVHSKNQPFGVDLSGDKMALCSECVKYIVPRAGPGN
ncbi:MAG: hypothetical protein DMG32_03735 [Acidobacteria bacterium]|nr:MAG: hypothetical protein DMG32_03735 [Acidobacteriota bacterium]